MWAVPNDRDRPVKKWRHDLPRGQGITLYGPTLRRSKWIATPASCGPDPG